MNVRIELVFAFELVDLELDNDRTSWQHWVSDIHYTYAIRQAFSRDHVEGASPCGVGGLDDA